MRSGRQMGRLKDRFWLLLVPKRSSLSRTVSICGGTSGRGAQLGLQNHRYRSCCSSLLSYQRPKCQGFSHRNPFSSLSEVGCENG